MLLKDLPFRPTASEEAIQKALEWLETAATKVQPTIFTRFHSLGNFQSFSDNGEVLYTQYNWACHATTYGAGDAGCVALFCANLQDTEKTYERFLKWLSEDSFASSYILAKSPLGIVVSGDIPGGLFHAICMVSRCPRQFHPEYFTRFNNLLDKGIPGDVAYMAVFNIKNATLSEVFYPSVNHRAWSCPGILGMKKFLARDFNISNTVTFRLDKSQHCSIFIPEGDLDRDLFKIEQFREEFSEYRKRNLPSEENYRPPNPFSKETKGVIIPAGKVTLQEMYDFCLPFCISNGVFNDEQ